MRPSCLPDLAGEPEPVFYLGQPAAGVEGSKELPPLARTMTQRPWVDVALELGARGPGAGLLLSSPRPDMSFSLLLVFVFHLIL